MNKKRMIQLAAAAMATTLMLTACGKAPSSQSVASGTQSSSKTTASEEAATLTYWSPINAKSLATITDYSELLCYQELEKKTNVKLQFTHPAAGQEKEKFNLLIISGSLPDLIEYNWQGQYPGGLVQAAADGLIIRLNEAIDQYAPNFKKFIEENPDIAKQFTADDGSIYCIPGISAEGNDFNGGLMIRQDWLDELQLETPETIEDWTNVLRTFKEKKGAAAPFTAEASNMLVNSVIFSGAYGVSPGFYRDSLDKNIVKFGPYEEGFKEYLKQMNSWYQEKLLDVDFAANDRKAVDGKILGDQSGALFGLQVGHMGRYLANKKDTLFNLVGVQFPVMEKGEKPQFGRKTAEFKTDGTIAVTTANKNIEATMRFADMLFTQEGANIMAFGAEGDTFVMENGVPTFTEKVSKPSDGTSMSDAIYKYTRGGQPTPGLNGLTSFQNATMQFKQQSDAQATWSIYGDNAEASMIPPVSMTSEEADRYGKLMADITPYCQEMSTKFIIGTESFDNYASFVDNLKKMGIEEAISIQQVAVDRYNAR